MYPTLMARYLTLVIVRWESLWLIFVGVVIAKIQWRPLKSKSCVETLLQHPMGTITNFILPDQTLSDRNLEPEQKRKWNRTRRSKALERFLLALSDQQLVTGLEVLMAGYLNPCSRSLYHFRIITTLGWFSSTTHLSTLAVLRAYLVDHPRSRDWRVIAMLYVFDLLVASQIITYSAQSNFLPIQCTLESYACEFAWLDSIVLVIVIIY